MVVFGTRPEAIKVAPVIHRLRQQSNDFETIIVATAQHRELLDQVLDLFNIIPDIDMNLMQSRQGLHALTGRVLTGMSETLNKVHPDIVLVQGDTTTAFTSALAAFYQQIPVGHIEAGLRTNNIYSPFPEEINRRLTTVVSDIHFAPTPLAKQSLLHEGISEERIAVTGNTVVDALTHILSLPCELKDSPLSRLDMKGKRLILVTSHRRESWGIELQNICDAVKELVHKYPDIIVVYPVHPNPVVRNTVIKILGNEKRIYLEDPLDYKTFIHLMKKSYLILTDSGGVQEESPTLMKPLLLMRNLTERPEAFQAGLGKIVGTDKGNIIREAGCLLDDPDAYEKMTLPYNPYGDGRAAERIVTALTRWVKRRGPLLTPHEEFCLPPQVHNKVCQNL